MQSSVASKFAVQIARKKCDDDIKIQELMTGNKDKEQENNK